MYDSFRAGEAKAVARYVLSRAQKKNMTAGDFVYLIPLGLETDPEKRLPWEYGDELDATAPASYRQTFMVLYNNI